MAYRGMLIAARDGIQPMVADGKTVEQVIAAKPTAGLDGEWGDGFLNPERFVRIVYSSMKKVGRLAALRRPRFEAGDIGGDQGVDQCVRRFALGQAGGLSPML